MTVTFDRRLALAFLCVLGWAIGIGTWLSLTNGQPLQPGVTLQGYLNAGERLLAGQPVYTLPLGEPGAFVYAPPWAIAFAALAWVPPVVLQVTVVATDLLALRYVTGGWQRAGLAFLYPPTAFVIVTGNLEILIAAAIVLAWRSGVVEPLVLMGLAKLGPFLAIPPATWRRALFALAVAVAITLPWLGLWADWIEFLLDQPPLIAISIGPPWYWRLPVALALVALRRPWAAALAVVVAMPSLYATTFVVLLAPISLWFDERAGRLPRWTARRMAEPTTIPAT